MNLEWETNFFSKANVLFVFVQFVTTLSILRESIKLSLLISSFLLFTTESQSQDTQSWVEQNIKFSGYVTYSNTSTFQDLDALLNDNLLHNRLNLKIFLNDNFTTALELRNRVFWGNSVQMIPNYAALINADLHDLDLSANIVDEPALLIHSKIDRLSVSYQSDKWQVTVGRQRINWGKNLAWNPNDLFNTYSFFDFDYEERPGADAVRVQYYTSGDSSIETAINYTKKWEDNTFALKYNFNKYGYDFQVLAAKYLKDYSFGLGWEGAIKSVGIKGELSYFIPQEKLEETQRIFVGSVSFDYYFKNGIFVNLASLYKSDGILDATNFNPAQFNSSQLTAKNLMPNRLSYFFQVGKSLTPATNISFSTIYAQELAAVFFVPQFGYNLAQNWDFDMVAQIFYGKKNESFSNIGNTVFLRFRWSF